jgi:RimJ/RimL family protein N-acetyltransferase
MLAMQLFTTKNLSVLTWTLDMDEAFFDLTQDEGFRLFPITNHQQTSHASAREWISKNQEWNEKGLGKYAVRERTSGDIIGMGGLTPWAWDGEQLMDITYRLRQAVWGKGYGMELAQALVQYGFGDLGLTQITATITPDNIPSKKIAEKLGLKFDRHITYLGVPTDLYRLYRD